MTVAGLLEGRLSGELSSKQPAANLKARVTWARCGGCSGHSHAGRQDTGQPRRGGLAQSIVTPLTMESWVAHAAQYK